MNNLIKIYTWANGLCFDEDDVREAGGLDMIMQDHGVGDDYTVSYINPLTF